MSRVLIVTWDGAGNLVPTLGIAAALVDVGHDVRLLGHRSIDERCGSAGWRFRPFERTRSFDSTARSSVDDEFAVLARDLWFGGEEAADVRAELDRERADVVLADALLMGALSTGQAAGVPTAALFHSPFSGFRGGPMIDMLAPAFSMVNALREELGLPEAAGMADVHDACALSLVAAPREFDMDMPLPANVRFVGPILEGPALTTEGDDLTVEDGPDPLVVVTFSTSYQNQLGVLQHVDALGALPARVVVTTGSAISSDAIAAPPNTTVVMFVPHRRLLPGASVVVTHGGLGTVMAALTHGVPLVCVPMGRDQYFNAAMVERLGAGVTIGPELEAAAIRAAVHAVLEDPTAKAGAKTFAGVIAGYGGAAHAVRELEVLTATN